VFPRLNEATGGQAIPDTGRSTDSDSIHIVPEGPAQSVSWDSDTHVDMMRSRSSRRHTLKRSRQIATAVQAGSHIESLPTHMDLTVGSEDGLASTVTSTMAGAPDAAAMASRIYPSKERFKMPVQSTGK